MSQKRSLVFIGGLMIGAAIGGVAGLLTAPRTGQETRKIVQKSADAIPELAEDISTSVQIQTHRLSAQTVRHWNQTINRLRDAIAVGIYVTQQQRQTLTKENSLDIDTTVDHH